MKLKAITILYILSIFISCSDNKEETDTPSIITSIANSLEDIKEEQVLTTESMSTFAENATNKIIELEKKVKELEVRVSSLEQQ